MSFDWMETAMDDKLHSSMGQQQDSTNETEMDAQTSLLSQEDEEVLTVKDMKMEGRIPMIIQ